MKAACAPVAQWLEQRAYTSSVPDKHMVVGSNPTGGTVMYRIFQLRFGFSVELGFKLFLAGIECLLGQ